MFATLTNKEKKGFFVLSLGKYQEKLLPIISFQALVISLYPYEDMTFFIYCLIINIECIDTMARMIKIHNADIAQR